MGPELLVAAGGAFVALFPVANPLGAVPIFYSMTAAASEAHRRQQAQQTALYVVAILAVTLLSGKVVLAFFGLSLAVVQIAGGLIVAHTAWSMVSASPRLTAAEHEAAVDQAGVAFTPMALPIIAGPGAMGVVIGLTARSTHWTTELGYLLGIILLGLVTYVLLALGEPLSKALGSTGMGAITRVFGFLILAIAVSLMADGTVTLLREALPGAAGAGVTAR